ncbi:hypothetical protein [Arcobacter sp.]|uniref:hypothetical protein n=1 Tax=unclassified Arcobacter TaxID=2593671 RepID=UPI003AFF8C1D
MKKEELIEWIDGEVKKIDEDERYHYRPRATIRENAPLAFVQFEMETKMRLLKEFKQKLNKEK